MSDILSPEALSLILSTCDSTPVSLHGLPEEDARWLDNIRECALQRGVPEKQWADVALYFMRGDLKSVMEDRKRHLAVFGILQWEWEDFKHEFSTFAGKVRKVLSGFTMESPVPWAAPPTFDGPIDLDNVRTWLQKMETSCQEHHAPADRWPHVATYFLTEDLRTIMDERRQHLMFFGMSQWSWDDFKHELLSVAEDANLCIPPEKLLPLIDSWSPPPVFLGLTGDTAAWLSEIEQACEKGGVPTRQWSDVAIHFLHGDLKTIAEERRKEQTRLGSPDWDWGKFQKEFSFFCGLFMRILTNWSDAPKFSGQIDEDAVAWTDQIAKGCAARQIPESRYADVALYFTEGETHTLLCERKAAQLRSGGVDWRWEEFKKELFRAHERGRKALFVAALHSWNDPPVCATVIEDYGSWFTDIEKGCEQRFIPTDLLPEAAMYFMRGELRKAMLERMSTSDSAAWTWEKFQEELLSMSKAILQKRQRQTRSASPALTDFRPTFRSARTEGDYSMVTAAAGLSAITNSESFPAVVMAVTNMSSWFRKAKARAAE